VNTRRKHLALRASQVGLAACTLCISAVVSAQEAQRDNFTFSIGAMGEYSDNYLRVDTDKESETFWSAFTRFSGHAEGERWSVLTAADIAYRKATDDALEDIVQGGFNGNVEYDVVKDYLQVFVQDTYGQVRPVRTKSGQNVSQPQPDLEQEDVNSLQAGARLTVPLGKRSALFSNASWTQSSQPGTIDDQTRTELTAGFRRSFSELSSATLSAGRSRVEFDALPDESGYDIDQVSLGFNANFARTDIDLSVGQTRVLREMPTAIPGQYDEAETSGLLLRADFIRKLGARMQLHLAGGTEYSDSSRAFVSQQQLAGPSQQAASIGLTSDPFKSDYAFLAFSYDGGRNDLTTQYSWRRQRFENETDQSNQNSQANQNTLVHQIQAVYSYSFTARVGASLTGTYQRSRAEVSDADSLYDSEIRAAGNIRLGRSFMLQPFVAHYKGTAAGFDYVENRFGIALSYEPTL
jgi:hypothetical protein